jgi:hypothetical protein
MSEGKIEGTKRSQEDTDHSPFIFGRHRRIDIDFQASPGTISICANRFRREERIQESRDRELFS